MSSVTGVQLFSIGVGGKAGICFGNGLNNDFIQNEFFNHSHTLEIYASLKWSIYMQYDMLMGM